MWPLRSVINYMPVQGRTLMSECVRQNKTYRYSEKNLSKVDNKGIRAGWRHCSMPLKWLWTNLYSKTKPEIRMFPYARTCSKPTTQTRYENHQVLPTKAPELSQGNVLVFVLTTSKHAPHTALVPNSFTPIFDICSYSKRYKKLRKYWSYCAGNSAITNTYHYI